MNRKIYHYLPCFIISFFITLFMVIMQASFFLTYVILKPDIYSEALSKNNITNYIYSDLETYFTRISAATGVPAEVYMKSVTKANLAQAANVLVEDSMRYLSDENAPKPVLQYAFGQLESDVTAYFESYAEENNIDKDEEYNKLLKSTIETAKTQISGKIDVFFLKQLCDTQSAEKIHPYVGMIKTAVYVSAIVIGILAGIMIYIIRHHKLNILYWLGVCCFSSAGLLLVPALYLDRTNYFSSFIIKTEYIHKAVSGLMDTMLSKIITFEVFIVILGVLLIAACAVLKSGVLSLKRRK